MSIKLHAVICAVAWLRGIARMMCGVRTNVRTPPHTCAQSAQASPSRASNGNFFEGD